MKKRTFFQVSLLFVFSCIITQLSYGQSVVAKINFTNTVYSEPGWTSFLYNQSSLDLGGGITLLNDTYSGSYYFITTGDSSATTFPKNVTKSLHYVDGDIPKTYQITGLDHSKTYNFEFLSSRAYTGTPVDRTTKFTIGAQSISINGDGNASNTVFLNNITPNASGQVVFSVSKDATCSYGYINFLRIWVNGVTMVTGVSISPTNSTISIGGTQQLTASITPTNATNQAVTWSSSNTAIATVNTSGLVMGVAAGTATITITTADQAKTATCLVTVSTVPVTGVTVSPSTASISVGGTQQLTATVVPTNATNKTVTWSSNNTAIATVNTSGLVTGVTAGTATITITTGDQAKTSTCQITVSVPVIPVIGVTVSPITVLIPVGSTQQLTATITPTNATNKSVIWSSSNTAVATVNTSGLVTSIAAGTSTITVITTDQAKTATCSVTATILTVNPPSGTFSAESNNFTFQISSNTNWNITGNISWLTISPLSGNNNGSFTVNLSSNSTGYDRQGTIIVTGGGLIQNISITQNSTGPISLWNLRSNGAIYSGANVWIGDINTTDLSTEHANLVFGSNLGNNGMTIVGEQGYIKFKTVNPTDLKLNERGSISMDQSGMMDFRNNSKSLLNLYPSGSTIGSSLEIMGGIRSHGLIQMAVIPDDWAGQPWTTGLLFYNASVPGVISAGFGLTGVNASSNLLYLAYGPDPATSKKGIYILPGGNVGIGTTTPTSVLEVKGSIKASNFLGPNGVSISEWDSNQYGINCKGNVGIKLTNPAAALDVNGSILMAQNGFYGFRRASDGIAIPMISVIANGSSSNLQLGSNSSQFSGGYTDIYSGATCQVRILSNGNVGIGLPNPAYKLDVFGIIRARELKLDMGGGTPDYVFKPGYKLKSLSEVDEYIKQNSHLPDIKPAEEIEKEGASIGEMQNKLLQKVEELTLYVIELNKKNQDLQQKVEKLENKLKSIDK